MAGAGPRSCAQNAHYALVRSLAAGTPHVDRYRAETGDLSYRNGHYYAAKAPGVAFLTLPVYAALHSTGLWPHSRFRAFWILTFVAAVIPALLLVALTVRVANRFEPGSGVPVGMTLALGTMILPFATLLFSHVCAALLAFACFALLLHERDGPQRIPLVFWAGVLAGLGVVFEYPNAFAGAILGILAIARSRWLERGAVYAGGVILGVAPLLAYNVWAFRSPFTTSYVDVVGLRGTTGHDVVGRQDGADFGITQTSLRAAAELLLSERGLLIVTPVVAAGVAGLILLILARRERAAALAALAICGVYMVYNAGVMTDGVFGGLTPGPRYLVVTMPFAMVALGVAYRRAPAAVLALGAVSVGTMMVATIVYPLVTDDTKERWWHGVADGTLTPTVTMLAGWSRAGYVPALPFLVCVLAGVVIAAREFIALRSPRLDEWPAVLAAVGGWWLLTRAGDRLLPADPSLGAGALAIAAAAVVAAAVTRVARRT